MSNYGTFDPWHEFVFDSNDVPLRIVQAQIVAALIYDAGGDPQATVARSVKREQVGPVSVEYMDNSASSTLYPALTSLIAPFLSGSSSGMTFAVSRA